MKGRGDHSGDQPVADALRASHQRHQLLGAQVDLETTAVENIEQPP